VKPVLLHDDAVAECTRRLLGTNSAGRDWGQNFGRGWSGPFPGFAAIRRPARGSGHPGSATSWSAVFPTSSSLPKAGRQSASWPSRTHGAGRVIGLDGHGTEDWPPLFTRNWRSSGEVRRSGESAGRGLNDCPAVLAPCAIAGTDDVRSLPWSTDGDASLLAQRREDAKIALAMSEVTYPCRWEYRTIGASAELMRLAIRQILGDVEYCLDDSHVSRSGKYCSLTLALSVVSEDHRNRIFAALSGHGDILMVL